LYTWKKLTAVIGVQAAEPLVPFSVTWLSTWTFGLIQKLTSSALARLVEALRYKPEGRRFDSR
jgi:hypothetical protein